MSRLRTTIRSTIRLLAGLPILATTAFADGMFVWHNKRIDIHEPEQKALLFHDDGREDLVLSVRFEGAPGDFGWVVPLPARPEMFPEDALLFEELSKATQSSQTRRSARGAAMNTKLGMDGVVVVSTETVGVYEATVLEADDGTSLRRWLRLHRYRLPKNADPVLQRYVERGWIFVALRIDPSQSARDVSEDLASGTIQPIRFRFPTPEPVFPLEISSLGAGPSTVLLYVLSRDLLVPAEDAGEWRSQVYSRKGEHHWIYSYEMGAKTEPFLPEYREPFHLGKHRRRFRREEMRDVHFVVYDAIRSARSTHVNSRVDAVVHMGTYPAPEAAPVLLDLLPNAKAARELFAILWALGETGGDGAEAALLDHLDGMETEVALESVEALARMRSRRALPHFVEGLRGNGDRRRSFARDHVQRACFDHLVEYGDSSCVDALLRIAAEEGGFETWSRYAAPRGTHPRMTSSPHGERNAGVLAVAALAACGHEPARTALVEALVESGQCTTRAALEERSGRRVVHGSFPGGFWVGYGSLASIRSTTGDWRALTWVYDLFSSDPAFRDSLLRAASRDANLPDAGVVLLTANLDAPSEADFDRLLGIWKRALRDPYLLHVPAPDPPSATLSFRHDACAVVYALARHKRVDDLLRLHAALPEDDVDLRGELVFAMAKTGDPAVSDVILEYVRTVWDANARTEEFENELDPGRTRSSMPFDRAYRVSAIRKYLFPLGAGDSSAARALLLDDALAPHVRLFVLRNANYFAGGGEALLALAQRVVQELRAEAGRNEVLATQLDDASVYLDRTAKVRGEFRFR